MGCNTTIYHLITALRQSFCRTGVPDIFWSDQGPQFVANSFQAFPKQWGFQHRTSSPRYPQSNGKIEASVKSMKKLITTSWKGYSLDEDSLAHALLQYRNTPSRKEGLSPAQKLYGRPIQDTLPAHRRAFSSQWLTSPHEAEQKAAETKEKVEAYYNKTAHPSLRYTLDLTLQSKTPKLKCGTYTELSQILDHIVATTSRCRLVAYSLGTTASYDVGSQRKTHNNSHHLIHQNH